MARKRGSDSKIREALRALLSDIEAMYEGPEASAESSHPEEYFGPFSVSKLRDGGIEGLRTSISWPCLAIGMQNALAALREADEGDVPEKTA